MWQYIVELMQMSKGVKRFIISESLLGISIGIFSLVYNLHLLAAGLSEADLGEISSIGSIVVGFASIPAGMLTQYFGRKKTLVSGLFLMATGYLITGLVSSYWYFYIAQIIFSIGVTLLINAEIQLLFSYAQGKKEETQAFNLLFAIFTLFTGVGTLIGGYLPIYLLGNTTKYQWAIIISALLMALGGLIRALWLPKEPIIEKKFNNKANSELFHTIFVTLKEKRIWLLTFLLFLVGSTMAMINFFLNVIVKFRFNWDDQAISYLLTVNGLFLFVGSLITPYLTENLGIKKTYRLVFLGNIFLTGILFFPIAVMPFMSILLIRGGMFTILSNLVESQTMQVVAEEERDFFAGFRTIFRSSGIGIASYFTGLILAQKNYYLPFFLSAVILLITYIYFRLLVLPIFQRELEGKKE